MAKDDPLEAFAARLERAAAAQPPSAGEVGLELKSRFHEFFEAITAMHDIAQAKLGGEASISFDNGLAGSKAI